MARAQVVSGADVVTDGVQFSLFSRHAEAVEVCLFAAPDTPDEERHSLSSDGNGWWSAIVPGSGVGQLYGFRVYGPHDPSAGHRFNAAKLLVDPRALAITGEPPLDDAFAGSLPGDDSQPDPRDTGARAPKSVIVERAFDWKNDCSPSIPWQETVLYECHVRGTSIRHPDVPENLRGTYLGLASEPVLDHFARLGITSLELLPIQQIASEPHLAQHGLPNYFGYSPLGFYAPHAGYARDSLGDQVIEFKQMVKILHQRGIEVILDLVLNHSAEGDHSGRTLSLRGVDNSTYYRLRPGDASRYLDSTGCGNSLSADNPDVARFLLDCLRYWTDEMHVDGFRFDLAVALGRTPKDFSIESPFFRGIAEDPVLSRTKLIAEPWDLGRNGYQLGNFPAGWLEWNDRVRDTTRKLWRGDPVDGAQLIEVFSGTQTRSQKHPQSEVGSRRHSVHFVTCHDGFTLQDLVSYEYKNNWSNLEENRDGHDHNFSSNWGAEGPTDLPEVLARRRRAKRNMLATILLSAGVPMLLHGDELNRTQSGNNNAYCQDNELTWLDWSFDQDASEMLIFASNLISLRKRLAPLGEIGRTTSSRWIMPDGRTVRESSPPGPGSALGLVQNSPHGTFLTMVNPGQRDLLFRLPRQKSRGRWKRILSTVVPGIRRISRSTYRLPAQSVSVAEYVSDKD
jgi:glycogen operon protein